MVPTLAVPTPYGCIGCKLPQPNYPPALITLMFCLMVVTVVTDLTGNSLVILAVGKSKKLRNSGNIFVVSLSVANMLVAIYPYPMMLHAMAIGGWDLSKLQCQVVAFITGLSVVGSIFNIMAIAINRYCYICHSLQYERIFSVRNTCIYLVVTWIMTGLAVLPNMYVGTIEYDPRTYTCIFNYLNNPIFATTIVCIHFVLPLLIVGFCYVRIWMKVLAARDPAVQNPDNQFAEAHNFLTMFVIFLLFAVCWFPVNVLTVLVAFNPKQVASKIPSWLYLAAHFLAYFNSCLNALIYGLLNENFRREYWTIFHIIRHPILFFSGVIHDIREMWEAGGLAHAHARAPTLDQAREQARGQDRAALEEIPMRVLSVPLPGNAADQPERASGHLTPVSVHSRPDCAYHKSVSDPHKSVISHSKLASGHPKSTTVHRKQASVHFKDDYVHFKPPSVHLRADSVYFKPASSHPKPIPGHQIPTGSPSERLFSPATSHPILTTGHIKPTIIGYPQPSAAGHSELTMSCYPETTAIGHLKCEVTNRPEPLSSPATGSLKPAATTHPLDSTVVTTDSIDYRDIVVLDVDSYEMAI
ncbi:unnamed protein product [Pipistrellus nathusii]|uniref:G-protein coupled receptors family 1 profile domain-containing protein n=1 Tax=Pipistrellus nathusii TaxID=59473 RepID=A0ABP0AM93_PIPNA